MWSIQNSLGTELEDLGTGHFAYLKTKNALYQIATTKVKLTITSCDLRLRKTIVVMSAAVNYVDLQCCILIKCSSVLFSVKSTSGALTKLDVFHLNCYYETTRGYKKVRWLSPLKIHQWKFEHFLSNIFIDYITN